MNKNLNNQNIARLNYQMIFEEKDSRNDEKKAREEVAEVKQLLKEKELFWKKKLEESKNNAYEQGCIDGELKGYNKAQSEIDNKFQTLEKAFEEAQNKWIENQKKLVPGLLGLVFDISEKILDVPFEDDKIREKLESELAVLLQTVNDELRPVLSVAEEDYAFAKELMDRFSDSKTVVIKVKKGLNPGEFILETEQNKVVRNYKMMLDEFKDNLSLPDWQ